MNMKTIALVGIGHVAEYQLASLASSNQWTIVGATDINPKKQANLLDGVPFFNTIDELINLTKPDLVLVATPNVTHFEIGLKVINAGCNLLLEKPCCNNDIEMDRLVQAANTNGVCLIVALHATFAKDLRWFIEHNQDWNLGTPSFIHACFFDPYIVNGKLVGSAESLGGSWFDSGINALSVVASILPPNELKVLESRITRIPIEGVSDIQAIVELVKIQSGHQSARVLIETNWTLGLNRKTTQIFYADCYTEVMLDHSREQVLLIKDGQLEDTIRLANDNSRLVNHYSALFEDAYSRLACGKGNLDFAIPIHRLLFEAGELKSN